MDLIWNNHYNSGSVPLEKKVGSFWWKDFLKYINKYKELATIIVGDGRSVNLWYDKWDNKIQNAVPPNCSLMPSTKTSHSSKQK